MKTRLLLQLVAVAFLVLGSLVAAASAMEPVWTYKSDERLLSFASSANGSYTAAGGDSGIVYFLDNDGKLLWKQSIVSQVTGIQLSSDGSLVTAINDRGAVYQFNRTGARQWVQKTGTWSFGGKLYCLATTPDGNRTVVGNEYGLVFEFDRAGNLVWNSRYPGGWIHDVTISNDGKIVAASDGFNVFTFDEGGNKTWTSPGWSSEAVLSGDGRVLAIGGGEGSRGALTIFRNFVVVCRLPMGTVHDLAVSYGGSLVAVACEDNTLRVFDTTGNLAWNYSTSAPVLNVAISTDGSTIAAATADNQALVFNRSGSLQQEYRTKGYIRDIALSKDGTWLVTGGDDLTISAFRMVNSGPAAPQPTSSTITPTPPEISPVTTSEPATSALPTPTADMFPVYLSILPIGMALFLSRK